MRVRVSGGSPARKEIGRSFQPSEQQSGSDRKFLGFRSALKTANLAMKHVRWGATVVLAEVSLNGNLFHGAVSQISLRRHGETGSVPMRAVDLFDAAEKGCAECCTKYIDQAG